MSKTIAPTLTIWAYSFCRSTLATYMAISNNYIGKVEIVMCGPADPQNRANAGFRSSEFSPKYLLAINPSVEDALDILTSRSSHIHMFCAYHGSRLFEALLDRAVSMNLNYFIAAEAPENMETTKARQIAKEIYIPTLLRAKVARAIDHSKFILCYSGHAHNQLNKVGWPSSKIEDFGYFPPPLTSARPDAAVPSRTADANSDVLNFLLTGTHCRHKSPITLIDAVEKLVNWGFSGRFTCTVTGKGLQTDAMVKKAKNLSLPVEFTGFVPLDELIRLYATKDVFVGTGVNDPWGVRVNDALQLGCPSIVSTGMGAHTIVEDSVIGWTYPSGSSKELAELMRDLIETPSLVQNATKALVDNQSITPEFQAKNVVKAIHRRFHLTLMPK